MATCQLVVDLKWVGTLNSMIEQDNQLTKVTKFLVKLNLHKIANSILIEKTIAILIVFFFLIYLQ